MHLVETQGALLTFVILIVLGAVAMMYSRLKVKGGGTSRPYSNLSISAEDNDADEEEDDDVQLEMLDDSTLDLDAVDLQAGISESD
jgi:hypothetical protein